MTIDVTRDVQIRVSRTRTGLKAKVVAFVMGMECGLTPNNVLEKAGVELQKGERWYIVYYNYDYKQHFVSAMGDPDDTVGYASDLAYLITSEEIPEGNLPVEAEAIKKGVSAFQKLTGSMKPIWVDKEY